MRANRRTPGFYDVAAPLYDQLMWITSLLDGVHAPAEREKLVRHLDLRAGQCVLEVAVGTGSNLPFIIPYIAPHGELAGVDLSPAMLAQCRQKLESYHIPVSLVLANAARLPFSADSFDAVLHFGGINSFAQRNRAIKEMIRVAKPGARVVVSDKSLPEHRQRSLRHRLLLKLQPQLAQPPPIDLVPLPEAELELSWFWGDTAYILEFTAPV